MNQNVANNDPDIAIEQIKVSTLNCDYSLYITIVQTVNARIIIAWLPITPVDVIVDFWCKVNNLLLFLVTNLYKDI